MTLLFIPKDRGRATLIEMNEIRKRLGEFLFPIASDEWLAVLRVGLGLQVIFYTWSLRRDWTSLFAEKGNVLISRDLTEAILSVESSFVPRLGWLITAGERIGISEQVTLSSAWLCLFGAGCFLVFGFLSRPAAILAWFFHLCAVKSAALFSYGMDSFTTIGLFYLMLSPLPDSYSLDRRLWKVSPRDPRLLGFFRRVLQLHLCLIYFFGGIAKCVGAGWWNGVSVWRALTQAPFNALSPEMLASLSFLLPFLGIGIVLIEVGYPFFIWMRKTRRIWLLCTIAMHVGIAVTMGLYLFALIMIILNVAAFGTDFVFRRRMPIVESVGEDQADDDARALS
jgi:hypothetical protein